MSGANSQVNLVGLDFDSIKNNLKTFLKSQDTFKDYNFEGSGMSVLLDVLAYNTQYNSFYLNMVANETFLDTALQRSSVVSQAKLLNYTPKSTVSPTAYIDIVVNGVTQSSLTLPVNTNFLSESVDGINYNFVTTKTLTENTVANTVTFTDVELKQGIPATYRFTVDSTTNPSYTFELPDSTIDVSTLSVSVQKSSSNSQFEVYTISNSYMSVNDNSKVFFLQESLNGNYEIIFGDGIIGKKLSDGNVVVVNYITSQGTSSSGANNFVLMDSVSGFGNASIYGKIKASQGKEKESIDSIKFQAPKTFSSQGRAVTKDDYINIIQSNNIGLTFDAVNVWGGEENEPPVYGQIFISLKPAGGYLITDTQKQRILNEVIKPVSVMTVQPTIVEPDYTYLQLNVNVLYDSTKTNIVRSQLIEDIKQSIVNFCNSTLNTFNSTFLESDLVSTIKSTNQSIITSEVDLKIQKKIYPNLTSPTTYKLNYGTQLQRGILLSGVSSSPTMQFRDKQNLSSIIDGIQIEEVPETTYGVESISIVNPGFGYQYPPTVTILGDGVGAKAISTITTSGQLKTITITSPGSGYTSAIAKVTPLSNDNTGQSGAISVNLAGRYGKLRLFYNNNEKVKIIYSEDIGTIDYYNGMITLNSFNPLEINDVFGRLTVATKPVSTIISSSKNRIITLDSSDPLSIVVNLTAKK